MRTLTSCAAETDARAVRQCFTVAVACGAVSVLAAGGAGAFRAVPTAAATVHVRRTLPVAGGFWRVLDAGRTFALCPAGAHAGLVYFAEPVAGGCV